VVAERPDAEQEQEPAAERAERPDPAAGRMPASGRTSAG
jgi:hypothetical protein